MNTVAYTTARNRTTMSPLGLWPIPQHSRASKSVETPTVIADAHILPHSNLRSLMAVNVPAVDEAAKAERSTAKRFPGLSHSTSFIICRASRGRTAAAPRQIACYLMASTRA